MYFANAMSLATPNVHASEVLFASAVMTFGTFIAPSASVLTQAVGINPAGVILAIGRDVGHTHGAGGHDDGHESPLRIFLLLPSGAQP